MSHATASSGVNGLMPAQGTNGNLSHSNSAATGLSADEIALYDRQIRLWGAQAQERIRSAHVLLISLRALGTEIAKNLTLAGISSLTIIDDEPVAEEDLGAQYFLREEDIGKPRASAAIPRIQELNPRVTVRSDGSLQDLLGKDQTYYGPFSCVIACDHDFMTLSLINTAARFACRPFYAAAMHGFYGFIFADLGTHEFVVERERSNIATAIGPETLTRTVLGVTSKKDNSGKTIEMVKKQEMYCPLLLANSSSLPADVLGNRRKLRGVPTLLPCLRALFEFQRRFGRLPHSTQMDLTHFTALVHAKQLELRLPAETMRGDFLRSFMHNLDAEMVPTAAFVGGRLSEDVINVLGQREQPIQNFALFDGDALEGKIYSLFTPPPEMAMLAQPLDGLMPAMSDGLGVGMNGNLGFEGNLGMAGGLMDGSMAMAGGATTALPVSIPDTMAIPDNMGNQATMSNAAVPIVPASNGEEAAVGAQEQREQEQQQPPPPESEPAQ